MVSCEQVEDLSKLPPNVVVELVPPDAASGSTDMRPTFAVRQHRGQEDMVLSADSASDSSSDEADDDDISDGDDESAGDSCNRRHFCM